MFRVKAQQPLPPPLQRFWLFMYAHHVVDLPHVRRHHDHPAGRRSRVPILGVLMALGGVVTWLRRAGLQDRSSTSRSSRSCTASAAAATAFTLAVAAGDRRPHRRASRSGSTSTATAIIQPAEGSKKILYSTEDGFVEEIRAKDGQWLKEGDVILVCHNEPLEVDIKCTQAELDQVEAEIRRGIAVDESMRNFYEPVRQAKIERLATLQQRKERLTVRAPIEGELISPQLADLAGRFVPANQELAMVQRTDKLSARVVLLQEDVEPVVEQSLDSPKDPSGKSPQRVEVRMVSDVGTFLPAESVRKLPRSREYLPSAASGQQGGGDVAVDPRDPSGAKPMQRQFEVVVTIDNPNGRYARGGVRRRMERAAPLRQRLEPSAAIGRAVCAAPCGR